MRAPFDKPKSCTDAKKRLMHVPYTMQTVILSKSDHMKAVGHRLRQLINALNIRPAQAARDMGIPKNHLGNWLRGAAYPLHYEMYRFCRIRGVDMDWVFLGDPSGLPAPVVSSLLEAESSQACLEEPDSLVGEMVLEKAHPVAKRGRPAKPKAAS